MTSGISLTIHPIHQSLHNEKGHEGRDKWQIEEEGGGGGGEGRGLWIFRRSQGSKKGMKEGGMTLSIESSLSMVRDDERVGGMERDREEGDMVVSEK
uniref:Uncharacterized protein n=1 Tax=Pristionchus pacificus TaxID=54126 RepID=A0A2A6B7S9_PRIPA|eukprot:PDM61925.1 hypothetical protein PRIPAC_51367 [Pristionchus pacificus]